MLALKDRLTDVGNFTSCGWADVLLNIYFSDDPDKHICEVQVSHHLMMSARAELGGHKDYEMVRSISEILDFNRKRWSFSADPSDDKDPFANFGVFDVRV